MSVTEFETLIPLLPAPLPLTGGEAERRDALAERLLESLIAGAELLTVEVGRRLGLYRALASRGPSTAAELAAHAGIDGRYAREWLEQQAAAGLLAALPGDPGDWSEPSGDARRFAMPAAHVPVLVTEDDPAHLLGAAAIHAGLGLALPAVARAFVSGGGVPYADFGAEIRHGIAGLNRPAFAADLAGWIGTMPDVVARLGRPGATILDAGCGAGWSSITLARTFPFARVHGVDLDPASVVEARAHAVAAGVADRVTFEVADAAVPVAGCYDLVCVFEALHDMGDPVAALASLREVLAAGAPVLVVDELVADRFTAPAGPAERLQYAVSVLHCLPATMAESPAVAHGTVLRTPTVREWALAAGFAGLTVLPVEHPFWRFYRLDA